MPNPFVIVGATESNPKIGGLGEPMSAWPIFPGMTAASIPAIDGTQKTLPTVRTV